MIDIRGKWALVTGASRGIGYLAAEFLAKEGCNLNTVSEVLRILLKQVEPEHIKWKIVTKSRQMKFNL